ncbi:hypothetical protein [Rhodoplanes elegans]|nr:hypothetical protein [Rhodoplanes elegans]
MRMIVGASGKIVARDPSKRGVTSSGNVGEKATAPGARTARARPVGRTI